MNDFYDIIGLLLWALMLGVYLLPTIVAWVRDHRKLYAIAAMNVMLGWTILGWIGALIWALTAKDLSSKKSRQCTIIAGNRGRERRLPSGSQI